MTNITTFSVDDMHCNSCPKLIELNLKDHPGVTSVHATLADKKVIVEYDPANTSNEKIAAVIKETGYSPLEIMEAPVLAENGSNGHVTTPNPFDKVVLTDVPATKVESEVPIAATPVSVAPLATPTSSTQVAMLSINGMHCSSCAGLIERSLKKVPGVKEANVNFASEKARIVYDPTTADANALVKGVEAAGYKAALPGEKEISQKDRRTHEISYWWNKFITGLVLSLPMILFMVYDFTSAIPLKTVIMPYAGITSLLLATPVLFYVGWNFFTGFWSALKREKTERSAAFLSTSAGPSIA